MSADVGPSIANLCVTCAIHAVLGFALARFRWWAGLPFLLFLLLTFAASIKRLSQPALGTALLDTFGPHYLAYHGIASLLAAVVILYGMRLSWTAGRHRTESASAV